MLLSISYQRFVCYNFESHEPLPVIRIHNLRSINLIFTRFTFIDCQIASKTENHSMIKFIDREL